MLFSFLFPIFVLESLCSPWEHGAAGENNHKGQRHAWDSLLIDLGRLAAFPALGKTTSPGCGRAAGATQLLSRGVPAVPPSLRPGYPDLWRAGSVKNPSATQNLTQELLKFPLPSPPFLTSGRSHGIITPLFPWKETKPVLLPGFVTVFST